MSHPYQTSRDYERLITLMKEGHRIVCLVDYFFSRDVTDPCRDICHTHAEPPDPTSKHKNVCTLWFLSIGARGLCYVGGMHMTDAKFVAECAKANLEWLVPSALPAAPLKHHGDPLS